MAIVRIGFGGGRLGLGTFSRNRDKTATTLSIPLYQALCLLRFSIPAGSRRAATTPLEDHPERSQVRAYELDVMALMPLIARIEVG
jgi:hypothetical protein